MNKLTIVALAMLSFTFFSCKQNAADKVNDANLSKAKETSIKAKAGLAEMTFVSKEFDFGTIDEGDEIDATFEFENTGKSDLIITAAKASCGCTVPEWPKNKAIKPGEKSQIKAHFKSRGKRNKQNKSITLTTNTLSGKEVIYVKGFVTPDPTKTKVNSAKKSITKKPVMQKALEVK